MGHEPLSLHDPHPPAGGVVGWELPTPKTLNFLSTFELLHFGQVGREALTVFTKVSNSA